MNSFHAAWGQIATWINGIVGLWGVAMMNRESVPRVFNWAVAFAIASMLLQLGTGIVILQADGVDAGNQHVFYGVLIAVTFSFAYIYRAQFRRRPALYYGLLLLFTMGLAIRGIMTFGVDF